MADKKYQINFEMTDGSIESVEFTVPQGEPGYTPVKGEDYFTEADKQEIAELTAPLVEVTESGGGSSEWKVIANVTLEEEVPTVTCTLDADGNPFALTDEIILCAKLLPNSEANGSVYTVLTTYSGANDIYGSGTVRSNVAKGVPETGQYCIYRYYKFNSAKNTFMPVTIMEDTGTNLDYTKVHGAVIFEGPSTKQAIPVDKIIFNAYAKMGVGSTICIYGR